MSRAALIIKNMTNYKLSEKGFVPFTSRAKSIAPLTTNSKNLEESPKQEKKVQRIPSSRLLLPDGYQNQKTLLPPACGFSVNGGMLRFKGSQLIYELLSEGHPYRFVSFIDGPPFSAKFLSQARFTQLQIPIFSGNFEHYEINQLFELALLNGLLPKQQSHRKVRLEDSALFSQMQSLQQIVNSQFIQHCNIFSVRKKKARTQSVEPQEVTGVLFTKNGVNRGQKPCVRTDFGMCSVGFEFFIGCG